MSTVALVLVFLFILGLFLRERFVHPMPSKALWIPFAWIAIVGSKSVSYWLGAEFDDEAALAARMDGSPLDRNIFILLLVAGIAVLARRKVDWKRLARQSLPLLLFFLYCGLSILWSDHPFVSTKRWIKDAGNLVMALVILTERAPAEALKSVLSRYVCFAIPASLLLILFFPEIGTHRDPWTDTAANIGITTNKNELGIVLVTSGLFLIWEFMEMLKTDCKKVDLLLRSLLVCMNLWLLAVAHSATAVACFLLGSFIILFLRVSFVRKQLRHAGLYGLIGLLTLLLFNFHAVISESVLKFLGRDVTLTGRTEIWTGLLREPVNHLVGSGYMSFWVDSVIDRYAGITQAHNGYLETWLNGGLIGLLLLLAMMLASAARLRRELLRENRFAALMFLYLVTAAVYNWTEAMFNGLSLVWFMMLTAVLASAMPRAGATAAEPVPAPARYDAMEPWYRIRNRQLARSPHGK